MKGKEIKIEDTEASHTLGGAGEGHEQGEGSGKEPSTGTRCAEEPSADTRCAPIPQPISRWVRGSCV